MASKKTIYIEISKIEFVESWPGSLELAYYFFLIIHVF